MLEQVLNISIGSSFHGTGDMRGVIVNTGYSKYYKSRIGLSLLLGATLHDKSNPLFYTGPRGENIDGSIRYTTGGLQFSGLMGYSLIKTTNHRFEIRAGGLLRYQSSSLANDVTILYPAGSGLPVPVLILRNYDSQRTFTVGASAQLFYNYKISQKLSAGLLAGFQTDTNGDVIRQLSISVGRTF